MNKIKSFADADFYGREWEQTVLQNLLLDGKNILITAPRRVGKTQLTRKVLDWARAQSWIPVYANVEDSTNEADFFEEIIRALYEAGIRPGAFDQLKNNLGKLRNALPSATISDGTHTATIHLSRSAEDELQMANRVLTQLLEAIAKEGQTILIGLDELPIFLTSLSKQAGGEARAAGVLNWFRKLREAPGLQSIRWLLCGSIGLDTFVEQRSLAGTINNLKPEKLGPFEHEVAVGFVKLLATRGREGFAISEELAEAIVAKVGWPLPFYLRLMVEELKAQPPGQRSASFPSVLDVDAAYASLVSPDKTIHFAHWVGRLELQFGASKSPAVHAILKQCCQKPGGSTTNRLRTLMIQRSPHSDPEVIERELAHTLTILQRDGYLHGEGSRWAFRSLLLRDFWLRHVLLSSK
jgi:uncharacterized protein